MSHLRYVNLRYERTATLRLVDFILTAGFRRNTYAGTGPDGYPITGDIITETIGSTNLKFGDAFNTPTLRFRITAYSVTENWILGIGLEPGNDSKESISHTYATDGPFTAYIQACCRIGNLNNGANGNYRAETIVDFTSGAPPPDPEDENAPPVVAIFPIITVVESAMSTFAVPAIDPEGDTLIWRFAIPAESQITPSVPPGMTINSATGVITWNNVGLNKVNFWTTQVIVEDMDGAVVLSKTPVDFLLKIVSAIGSPPVCELSGESELCVQPETTLAFTLTASDVDPGATVEINMTGLPPGATMTPALPVTGAGSISSDFSWTPTLADLGVYVIQFSATDNNGLQSFCSATITVQEAVCPDSPIPPPPPVPTATSVFTTCNNRIICDCADSPVTNYSSERPDTATFIGTYRFKGIPPLGVTFAQLDCVGICYSEVSQAEADLCAEAQSKLCVMDSLPGPPWKNPDGTSNFSLFSNQATSCTIDCATNAPCGDCAGKQTFRWTVAAGTVIAASQIEANLQAASICRQQAVANKICFLTKNLTALCIDEGAYKEIRAAGGTPWPWRMTGPIFCNFDPQYVSFTDVPYHWELIAGELPPGLTLGECTGTIVGTPTTSGTYTFTIKITDYIGSTQTREFSIVVASFTNADPLPDAAVDTPYTLQMTTSGYVGFPVFSISAGALPTGLSLDTETGEISGTPTEGGVFTFTICAEGETT